ncbi:MAG TPA: hypothetical protein VIJ34_08505 [Acidimicrobiales bacterium]
MPANSDLYTISLSADNKAVEVTLAANDPGMTVTDAPTGAALYEADGTTPPW